MLDYYNLRIYTEYHYQGSIADLAIVKLNNNPGNNNHLQDDIESVLAILKLSIRGM